MTVVNFSETLLEDIPCQDNPIDGDDECFLITKTIKIHFFKKLKKKKKEKK